MFPSLFENLDVQNFHCEIYEFAKHHKVPFPSSESRSMSLFSTIHFDIWGPYNIPNISGAKGFVIFIDDCTRMTWVFLIKRKSDVSHILLNFTAMIKKQFGLSLRDLGLIMLETTLIRIYHNTLTKELSSIILCKHSPTEWFG